MSEPMLSPQQVAAPMLTELLRVADVAKILSVSAPTVYREIEEKRLKVTLVRGAKRVTREALAEYIQAASTPAKRGKR